MFRPASIIVANWREKICSDFGLIFLKVVRAEASPLAGSSSQVRGEQAADAELLARRRAGSGACTSPADSMPTELIAL